MSQTRLTPGHEAVKKLRQLSHPLTDKPYEIFTHLSRILLLLCLVSSISFLLYTSFFKPRTFFPIPNPRVITRPDFGPEPTNMSHILFSIGGSSSTWKERSVYSLLWWVPGITRGYVWFDKLPKRKRLATEPEYRLSSPEWTRFKYSSSKSAVRIARIVSDAFKQRVKGVRWFVMGDDDTVYYTENLITVLRRYDHNEMWYIGMNSESIEQDVMHSFDMGFGGGGFAMSYPLVEKLVNVLDGCLDRYFYFYGSDQRIWACVSEVGVELTKERGFHQLDIRGNPYGLLSAHPLSPLVSLHHLDYVDPLFPNKTRIDSLKSLNHAYQIDPPRILQQTFCHDYTRKWSFSISWGYTVQLYPFLLPAKDLQTPLQTFKTWRSWGNGPFTFNTRPMGEPCEQPVVYMLEKSEEVDNRGSLTYYEMVVPEPANRCNRSDYARVMSSVRRIVVSSAKLRQDYWLKAVRRQCCELMNRGQLKSGNLQVRIRSCKVWETVTG